MISKPEYPKVSCWFMIDSRLNDTVTTFGTKTASYVHAYCAPLVVIHCFPVLCMLLSAEQGKSYALAGSTHIEALLVH